MQKAIQELLKLRLKSPQALAIAKRKLAKKFGSKILLNSEILKNYRREVKQNGLVAQPELEKILRKRAVRTLSGIAPVAVLTKPFPCPGKCVYCPTEKDVPQSYLSNEPAVMRAIRCCFNPYKQVRLRLQALENNGHTPEKIELIVIGGTWSVLPEAYKYWYIANCFKAANDYQKEKTSHLKFRTSIGVKKLKKLLLIEQRKNESAQYRIIGVTLETRPDYINEKELLEMRDLGCTRVELGVQAIDDEVLKINRRGHGIKEITEATKLLKNFGFKVTYHIMPGLPGSTPALDLKMFKKLFSDSRFQPDQIKLYPTVVTRGSLLYRWWRSGKYKPYSDKVLQNLIINCKKIVPPYVRIIRLIRDIPKESIIAGNSITNLRQIMKNQGAECNCIRCREAGNKKFRIKNLTLLTRNYPASDGMEYFISYESKDEKTLFGFCRLRLPSPQDALIKKSALIRELHIYGDLVPVGQNKKIQHAGLGKRLMVEAEKIAKSNGYKKIMVISGVGVRGYYKKIGYRLRNTYMVK